MIRLLAWLLDRPLSWAERTWNRAVERALESFDD